MRDGRGPRPGSPASCLSTTPKAPYTPVYAASRAGVDPGKEQVHPPVDAPGHRVNRASANCGDTTYRRSLFAKALETGDLPRHAERAGLGEAVLDQLGGPRVVTRRAAVEEHGGPGAAGAGGVGTRAQALVHRQAVREMALGI